METFLEHTQEQLLHTIGQTTAESMSGRATEASSLVSLHAWSAALGWSPRRGQIGSTGGPEGSTSFGGSGQMSCMTWLGA